MRGSASMPRSGWAGMRSNPPTLVVEISSSAEKFVPVPVESAFIFRKLATTFPESSDCHETASSPCGPTATELYVPKLWLTVCGVDQPLKLPNALEAPPEIMTRLDL